VGLALAVAGALWAVGRGDPVDRLMARTMRAVGAAGATVAFGPVDAAPAVRAYGLADAETGAAMTPGARFRLASLSKPVTAAAILSLVREGAAALDDRLATLRPETQAAADARLGAVSLRDLLRHSAGWDAAEAGDPFFAPHPPMADCAPIAAASLGQPLQFAPGARYAYSNLGYCWLGLVLAERFGSYEAAVRALVPGASALTLDGGAVEATGRVALADARLPAMLPAVIAPAGGWIGSAAGAFAVAAAAVDPAVFERPPYASGRDHYGLGWRVWPAPEGPTLTHFGSLPGVFTVAVRKQDGTAFVALFTGRPQDGAATLEAVLDIVRRLDLRRLSAR
jgi:CubicO group peptidase (beta-lactamase class C family)